MPDAWNQPAFTLMKLHFESCTDPAAKFHRVNFLNQARLTGAIIIDDCGDPSASHWPEHLKECRLCKVRRYAANGWSITGLRVSIKYLETLQQQLTAEKLGWLGVSGQSKLDRSA